MSSINNPSPPSSGGGGGATTPTLIEEDATYEVPIDTQMLVAIPIYIDGTISMDGSVIVE